MTTREVLIDIKQQVATRMRQSIVRSTMPLSLQSWAIKRLLPMDPWPKSLAYQQCLADRILREIGPAAQSGPFEGMICIQDANEGCLVPKLLGCYEEELIPTFEHFFEQGFDRFIDAGCASGYWLTGVARRMPNAKCYGFDGDEEALARCRELLALNQVESRVQLFGFCTGDDLQQLIGERTLLLMDVDGPEYELLDPDATPALRQADIIVECHDHFDPRIQPALLSRFESSHSIEKISSRERQASIGEYPGLRVLPEECWHQALAERRLAPQDWLVMRKKT